MFSGESFSDVPFSAAPAIKPPAGGILLRRRRMAAFALMVAFMLNLAFARG